MMLTTPRWALGDFSRLFKQLVGQPIDRLNQCHPMLGWDARRIPLAWCLLGNSEQFANCLASNTLNDLARCEADISHTNQVREIKSHSQDYKSLSPPNRVCIIARQPQKKLAMKKHWSERLNSRRKQLGWTQRELAKRSKINEDVIRKYIQGGIDKPRGDVLTVLAKVIGVSHIWLEHGTSLQNMTIPLLGFVGAGEQFVPAQDLSDSLEIRAEDLDLFAVTVRGVSGLPVYKPGEVVVCSRTAGSSQNSFLNSDAVVMLRDGRAFLKKIVRGAISGTYTLHSYNDLPIENVWVEWVAPVVMVIRKPELLQS